MNNTLTDYIRCKQYEDPRLNPRTRDLDCEVGAERTEDELDGISLEIQKRVLLELGSSALMFNEPQFVF